MTSAPVPPPTFTHAGTTIRVHDTGTGPTVVFLHNGGTAATIWRHQRAALTGCRVVAPDLPGFGESPRPRTPCSHGDLVELIVALMQERELAPAVLVGNCMGANIAATLARTHPDLVAGLLLVNPLTAATFDAGSMGLLHRAARAAPAAVPVLAAGARLVRLPGPIARATLRLQLGPAGRTLGLDRDPDLLRCQQRRDQVPALLDVLGDLDAYGTLDNAGLDPLDASGSGTDRHPAIPTWVVWGSRNRVLSARAGDRLDGVLRPDRSIRLDRCGHLPMLEEPEVVTDLVADLVRLAPTAAGATGRTNAPKEPTPTGAPDPTHRIPEAVR